MATRPATAPAAAPTTLTLRPLRVGGADPGQGARGRGHGGDHERLRRQAVGAERGAGVEAEPAEPQEAGAQDGHGHVVRLDVMASDALAHDQRHHERRDARGDVDHGAAGEVERARVWKRMPPPHTMWAIGE